MTTSNFSDSVDDMMSCFTNENEQPNPLLNSAKRISEVETIKEDALERLQTRKISKGKNNAGQNDEGTKRRNSFFGTKLSELECMQEGPKISKRSESFDCKTRSVDLRSQKPMSNGWMKEQED